MKYKLFILFLILSSCVNGHNKTQVKPPYNSKGLAYIYTEKDFIEKIILKKFDNNDFQIAHNRLRPGSLIKLTNPLTNESIILKNSKRVDYPDFYKILITSPVAKKINLDVDFPLIELLVVKKNKSFIAKKTKIFQEEKTIHSNAPVELVKIDNISKTTKTNKIKKKDKIYIVIGDFYSRTSAYSLKKRITQELINFDSKKLFIKSKKTNKTTLVSGPYGSINLMKNDYIQLKKFGFEELDITINE
tara:strand:+ start:131 stop:868 length:738 start_codon:yes stop_codon:yes gene_type:complete